MISVMQAAEEEVFQEEAQPSEGLRGEETSGADNVAKVCFENVMSCDDSVITFTDCMS